MCAVCQPTNADVVGAIYAAFERGDIAYILDQLDDDVSWDADWYDNSAQSADVAHLRPRRGPEEVAEYFAVLADWQIKDLKVVGLIASGRQVVAEIQIDAVLPGGGRLADQQLHMWTFDDENQVLRFRQYGDTAKHIAADSGTDTVHSQGAVITGFLLGVPRSALR